MADFETPPPRRPLWKRIVRIGFPQVVIGLGASLYFGTMIRAGHHIERQWFELFRMIDLIVCGTLLALWALFFSGWPKTTVSLTLITLGVGSWGTFRIETDGDIRVAAIHPRDWVLRLFKAASEDDADRHRQLQAGTLAKRAIDLTPHAGDFPGYRGLDRSGIVIGPPIARDWRNRPPREIWKQPTYGGYSAFAVVNGFLFTMEQRRDDEAVACYDAENGNELWVHKWPGRFDEGMGGAGPRATPTVFDGDVYALGALGRLVCLDGKTGNLKWSVETLAHNKNLQWAMSGSPLVYGDLVVVNPGTQSPQSVNRALVAYDRHRGNVVWASGKSQAGYSAPMLVQLAGRSQILLFDGAGLAGYDPDNGRELWRHPWRTQGSDGINVAQPIVVERQLVPPIPLGPPLGGMATLPIIDRQGQVFIASGYGRGGALLQIEADGDQFSVQEVWTTGRSTMRCKFSSPILHDGYIYGLDDGDLQCLDLNDGRVMWTDNRGPNEGEGFSHGQLLLSGDLLVVLSQFGEVALVEARPDHFHELGRIKVLAGKRTWNNPAMSDGRLYIRNHVEMAALDLR